MKKTLVAILIVIAVLVTTVSAQDQKLIVGAGQSLIGSGDVLGKMFFVEKTKFKGKILSSGPRLSIVYGRKKERLSYLTKDYKHLIAALDYDFRLYLLKMKSLIFNFSGGPSVRFAHEDTPGRSWRGFDENGVRIAGIDKYKYTGFNFGATVGFNIAVKFSHISLGLRAASSMYNEGTSVFYIGPTIEYHSM